MDRSHCTRASSLKGRILLETPSLMQDRRTPGWRMDHLPTHSLLQRVGFHLISSLHYSRGALKGKRSWCFVIITELFIYLSLQIACAYLTSLFSHHPTCPSRPLYNTDTRLFNLLISSMSYSSSSTVSWLQKCWSLQCHTSCCDHLFCLSTGTVVLCFLPLLLYSPLFFMHQVSLARKMSHFEMSL